MTLKPHHIKVAVLISHGKTDKEIGMILGYTHKSVNYYRSQIYEILGINNVALLTRYVIEHKLDMAP